MKKLICIVILLILAIEFNHNEVKHEPTDLFDQIMIQQYPDYNNWPERTKKAFKREFYESRNKDKWFPDSFPEFTP